MVTVLSFKRTSGKSVSHYPLMKISMGIVYMRASLIAPLVKTACNAGDLGSIPGLGRSPEEGKGHPLQYSGLENSMDCVVQGVAKSQTWLSGFHFSLFRWSSCLTYPSRRSCLTYPSRRSHEASHLVEINSTFHTWWWRRGVEFSHSPHGRAWFFHVTLCSLL